MSTCDASRVEAQVTAHRNQRSVTALITQTFPQIPRRDPSSDRGWGVLCGTAVLFENKKNHRTGACWGNSVPPTCDPRTESRRYAPGRWMMPMAIIFITISSAKMARKNCDAQHTASAHHPVGQRVNNCRRCTRRSAAPCGRARAVTAPHPHLDDDVPYLLFE